jgi:hypothetical protein
MNKLKFFDQTETFDGTLSYELFVDENSTRVLVVWFGADISGDKIFSTLAAATSVNDFNSCTDNKVHYGIELEGRYTEHAGVISADPLETAVLATVLVSHDTRPRRRRVIIYGLPSAPGNFDSLSEFNEWIERCPFAIDVWLVAKE